jgi:hypothetical protein
MAVMTAGHGLTPIEQVFAPEHFTPFGMADGG